MNVAAHLISMDDMLESLKAISWNINLPSSESRDLKYL